MAPDFHTSPGLMSDVSKRLEKADKYIQKGKLEDALKEFEAILDDDPENGAVRERAADLAITLNRSRDAVAFLGPLFDQQAPVGDAARAARTTKNPARMRSPRLN